MVYKVLQNKQTWTLLSVSRRSRQLQECFIRTAVTDRACERSGKRSRASRKCGEREWCGEQTFQKTLEQEQSVEQEAAERSGELVSQNRLER